MKKLTLIIITALLPFFGLYASSISVSGNISTNTTWIGVDTVKVTGNIYVDDGITLTIAPGIFVVFQAHYKLEVDGRLLAVGTETDTITFTVADTTGYYNNTHTGWNRIVFVNTSVSNDSSKVVFCKLEYGKANTTGYGGAVYAYSFNKIKISNSLFKNNYAVNNGGAIYCNSSNIDISNCFITQNNADLWGGGIYLIWSDAEIKNCIISNNTALNLGGGISCEVCNPLLINNLIAGNSVGGVELYNSNATMLNNTITDNSGQGVWCDCNADPVFRNTIIYGNSGVEVYLEYTDCDPDFYYCDIQGGTAAFGGDGAGVNYSGDYENCIGANPQFVGSGEHPYDLNFPSDCINAGDPATTNDDAGSFDLAGGYRILNERIDIGAYEQTGPDGFPGTALEFDGVNDYVSILSDASLNNPQFTVEFWVAANNPGNWQGILDKGSNTNTDWYFLTGNPGQTEGVIFGIGNGSSQKEISYFWNDTLWHHVAGTYDGTTLTLYVDGRKRDSDTYSYSNTNNNIVFGSRRNQGWPFEGKIDEVAIWDHVRSIQEIRENMYLTYGGTESGLTAYWQFNEEDGDIATELINDNNGILNNMDNNDRVESPIPCGEGQSETQIVSTTGMVYFNTAGVQMNVSQKTGTDTIVVSRINRSPNISPSGSLPEVFDSQYWIINAYGSGTFSVDPDFKLQDDLTSDDEANPAKIELYSRGSNSDTAWAYLISAVSVSATNDSASFQGLTSFSQFIIARGIPIDSYPGTVLEFDGTDDYVSIPSDASLVTPLFTVEFWVEVNNPGQYQGMLDKGRSTNNNWYFLTGSSGNTEGVIFGIGNGSSQQEISYSWNDSLWHHVAGTYDGTTMKLYVDGQFRNSGTHSYSSTDNDIFIGSRRDQSFYLACKIDEIAIWDDARSTQEIRENMHHPLSKTDAGLLSYWQFNDESGSQLTDAIGGNHGTLHNMNNSDWVISTIPFGGGYSNTQIVSTTGNVNFPGTSLTMNFTSKTGTDTIVATRIDTIPNIDPIGTGTIFDEQYWVVNRFGSGTFTTSLTFTLSEDLSSNDESFPEIIELYTRASNADSSWAFLKTATSVNAANDQATFTGISNFSQFIITRKKLPEISLLAFPLNFSYLTQNFNSIDVATYSAPSFTDIDGDGLLDLIIGEYFGKLYHYEQNSENSASFTLVSSSFNSIDVGDYSKPCFTDLDGDGLLDLIIGEHNGNLNHYEQNSENSTSFSLVTNNFNSIYVGHNLAPSFTDLDGDGLLDLIIGESVGNLNHYEQDSENSTSFSLVSENFNSINVGTFSTPSFIDLDGDGLLDLIIGERDGNLNHYEQNGENSISFSLVTNNFNSIDVGYNSTPAFTDIEKDGLLDLIIAEDQGNLNHYEQDGVEPFNFPNILAGDTSSSKSYIASAKNLINNLNIVCPAGFKVSLSEESGFLQSISVTPLDGSISDTIYVRFEPDTTQLYSGNIVHSSDGAEIKNINVSGKGIKADDFPGNVLDFDGTDDYVSISSDTSLNNPQFTVEFWVATNNPGNYKCMLDKGWNSNSDWYFLTGALGQTEGVIFGIGEGSAKNEISYSWNDTLWHHVAGTYDGTSMKLYVDGYHRGTETFSFSNTTNNIVFGSRRNQSEYFKGKMDEVRIWNFAIDTIQIREHMHLTLDGNETGLAGYWQFNENSGTTASAVIGSDGTLNNMSDDDWIESTVATGGGESDTQTETAGTVDFTGTGLSMYYNTQNGASVTVTRIDTSANLYPNGVDTTFDNQYWVVNRFGSGTFNADLTFTIAEDLTTADQNNPAIISLYTRPSNADTGWAYLASASAVDAANNTATFYGITGFSQFIIAREIDHTKQLDLTVFLEGPYDNVTGLMLPNLNPDDIPLTQPYNTAPWNYSGTESVASIPNANVVDWVLIELRDTTDAALATPEAMIARQAAFLLNDGSVVGMDGVSILSFNHSIIHELFTVIWHRNHLGIMSAYPVTESGGVYTYNFTTPAGQAYGTDAQKDLGSGVYGLYSGNANADVTINTDDKTLWTIQAGTQGYKSADFDMDGQVNNTDKNEMWVPNDGEGSQVPE